MFTEKEKVIYKENYDRILFLKTENMANQGDIPSKKLLADMLLQGKGTDKNEIRAVSLLFDLAMMLDESSRYKLCEHKDIVLNKIKHILNKDTSTIIGARKCEVNNITSKQAKQFLDKFHIQGFVNSTIYYG